MKITENGLRDILRENAVTYYNQRIIQEHRFEHVITAIMRLTEKDK